MCCSGLCRRVSCPCLLWWEPTVKASVRGKSSPPDLHNWLLGGPKCTSEYDQNTSCFYESSLSTECVSFAGVISSSLSQWVHACDALELPCQQREHLDSFIDQLYKDVDKGQRFISAAQSRRQQIIPVTAGLICIGHIVRASVSHCALVLSRQNQPRNPLTVT